MKAPLSWLKDYVDIDVTAQELQAKLFSCGFEVEELIDIGKDISGVVVGEVIECVGVEGTHLHVCKVDCGSHGVLQICCGADNIKVGIKVPCALVGATVYATAKDHVTIEGVMTIKKGKLRGIDSFGMLCSGVEIGINGDMFPGGDYNGLLILPNDCINGEDVKPILGLDDYIFDIGVTANRPDCQSILGIAREVAAVLKKELKEPNYSFTPVEGNFESIEIVDEAPELCPRYIGHYVTDIKIGQSPDWLKKRLALCGLRSISNIVDITNFVLLEMGQPMHAFDLQKLSGRKIVVRRARENESITTLDEKTFKLNTENLVICDGDKPTALAGIMGGLESEITENTNEVLFEAAKFARDSVRKTSRALGQHSDSSSLFEKGVSEYTVENGMNRALHLIEALGCGKVTNIRADVKTPYSNIGERKMTASISAINKLLGIQVPVENMVEILSSLNFKVEVNGDMLNLTVPAYREDIDLYPDIAEEIIRMYGYTNITPTFLPSATITNGGFNDEQKMENNLKDLLVALGMYEISTYSFYSEKDLDMLLYPEDAVERKFIKIRNPIGEDLSVMRTTLAPSMLNTIVRNIRRGNSSGELFEIAKIYLAKELPLTTFPEERPILSLGVWGNDMTFFTLKGTIEAIADSLNVSFEFEPAKVCYLHPGMTANVICDNKVIGYLGKLAPTIENNLSLDKPVFIAQIDYKALTSLSKAFKYKPLPKFTEYDRDLAFVCDKDITCAQIEREIFTACKYVTKVRMFDIYTGSQIGEDKKSMAFNVTFTPKDEEITPENVDNFVKKILKNLEYKLGITLR